MRFDTWNVRSLYRAGSLRTVAEEVSKYKLDLLGVQEVRRPRRRWVDNIKMDLRDVGWDGRDWIDLAQDRDRWRAYVNAVMNLRVP
jgi:exonuclease III